MPHKLSEEERFLLENITKYFQIYYECISNQARLKEMTKDLFFYYCKKYDINPKLAADFLSEQFKKLNNRDIEQRITTYYRFENFRQVVDLDKKWGVKMENAT